MKRTAPLLAVLLLLSAAAVLASILLGSVPLAPGDALSALLGPWQGR